MPAHEQAGRCLPVPASSYMLVQPTRFTEPDVSGSMANATGVPPFIEPTSSEKIREDEFGCLITITAKAPPSRETVDQTYWVYVLNNVVSSAVSLLSRVSPVPSVFIFHNPLWLLSMLPAPVL